MLRRQFFLAATATGMALLLGGCAPAAPTQITIGMEQIQTALHTRFPQRFPVAGLLLLEMQQPQLQLLPQQNQVATQLKVSLSGAALPQVFTGHMGVRFGLHYDPKNHSVRAERVEVDTLVLDGAAPTIADMVSTYGLRLAEQALDGLPLYTLSEDDLQLASRMDLQPGAITVTNEGLSIQIVRKKPV